MYTTPAQRLSFSGVCIWVSRRHAIIDYYICDQFDIELPSTRERKCTYLMSARFSYTWPWEGGSVASRKSHRNQSAKHRRIVSANHNSLNWILRMMRWRQQTSKKTKWDFRNRVSTVEPIRSQFTSHRLLWQISVARYTISPHAQRSLP